MTMPTISNLKIKRALISVSDKTGICHFAQQLQALGIELIATGGTAKYLINSGISITTVSNYTQFPELLEGRVKTLHPKIHAGILARKNHDPDNDSLKLHNIPLIDLIVVNLYPFQTTLKKSNASHKDILETIDIGGPTLLRAAAKNYARVTCLVNPSDYQPTLQAIKKETLSEEQRKHLAKKVFEHTSYYDHCIAHYLENNKKTPPPPFIGFKDKIQLRYGENPHQSATLYRHALLSKTPIASQATQLQGPTLSYNNVVDAHAAFSTVISFNNAPTCAIVKHANPCGVATRPSLSEAYQSALATDPVSAFGGIVAFNQPLDQTTAEFLFSKKSFIQLLICPSITEEAKEVLKTNPKLIVLITHHADKTTPSPLLHYQSIGNDLLVQTQDITTSLPPNLVSVTQKSIDEKMQKDLYFAWKVVKMVKSNAIVLAKNMSTIGIGAGQMSRVDSTFLACYKAKQANLATKGAILASDAFFPFPDAIEQAAKAGIQAIIQPGGSIRDQLIIEKANTLGIAMIMTGIRHFKH